MVVDQVNEEQQQMNSKGLYSQAELGVIFQSYLGVNQMLFNVQVTI